MLRAPESSKYHLFLSISSIVLFRFQSVYGSSYWKNTYSRNQYEEFTIIICTKKWLVEHILFFKCKKKSSGNPRNLFLTNKMSNRLLNDRNAVQTSVTKILGWNSVVLCSCVHLLLSLRITSGIYKNLSDDEC
jgi:hypothetical protein